MHQIDSRPSNMAEAFVRAAFKTIKTATPDALKKPDTWVARRIAMNTERKDFAMVHDTKRD